MPKVPERRVVKDRWTSPCGRIELIHGDCLEVLPTIEAGSADCVVTDPPYGLKFMGKKWDHGIPGVPTWEAVLATLADSSYLLTFGGTRTYHRLACAVEDAGFEIRDCLNWLYGSGFPKGKGCLKPAWEPILLARKPGKVKPLGIDECRVGTSKGRWPANVVHDGSDEVMEGFPETTSGSGARGGFNFRGGPRSDRDTVFDGDSGSAARFFYCAKASRAERNAGLEGMPEVACGMMEDDAYPIKTGSGNLRNTKRTNHHPTVKPLALLQWLVKLACPPGAVCLDPFIGSGSTALACLRTGRRCIGIEIDKGYFEIAKRRVMAELLGDGTYEAPEHQAEAIDF